MKKVKLTLSSLAITTATFAQGSIKTFSDAKTKIATETSNFVDIIGGIGTAIFAIGLIYLVFQGVTGDQNAWKKALVFFAMLAIWSIGWYLIR